MSTKLLNGGVAARLRSGVSWVGTRVNRSFSLPRILMYHRVVASSHRLAVTPELFRTHLDILESEGVEVLSVRDFLACDADTASRAVALTFDDGYREMFDLVAPELSARGMGGTFYVISAALDGRAVDLDLDAWPQAGRPFMNVDEVRTLHRAGFEIGGHTDGHPSLPTLSASVARREIEQCGEALEGVLGERPTSFAYPRGHYTTRDAAIVREAGFTNAVTVRPGRADSATDPWQLQRTEIAGGDDPATFRFKLSGGFDRWHQWRQRVGPASATKG